MGFPSDHFFKSNSGILYQGDVLRCLKGIPDESVDCIITSPPYWALRDYDVKGQIGLESTLDKYLKVMLKVTMELKRVLKKTGVMFWNHGDNYSDGKKETTRMVGGVLRNPARRTYRVPSTNSIPVKSLCLQNYRLIIRMIDEQGWVLRNVIIWSKPNYVPRAFNDRFINTYEPVFMLVKSKKYWFDLDAVRVPHRNFNPAGKGVKIQSGIYAAQVHTHSMENHPLGKNPGDVWVIPMQPFPESHFATFPERLVEPMIKAGCPQWVCKKCEKARERIVEREVGYQASNKPDPVYQKIRPGGNSRPISEFMKQALSTKRYTLGWTDCGCNAGWEPGIVLDPFMGSGTVALVAERLSRRWVGIELNPEYCEMIVKRVPSSKRTIFTIS